MREALIAYVSSKDSTRPAWIDVDYKPAKGRAHGEIKFPAIAGSVVLRREAENNPIEELRLYWNASEKGAILACPAGEYKVVNYRYYALDKSGALWTLSCTNPAGCATLKVEDGRAVEWAVVPEVSMEISLRWQEEEVRIPFVIEGANHSRMTVSKEGVLAEVTFEVLDAQGKMVGQGAFEYG